MQADALRESGQGGSLAFGGAPFDLDGDDGLIVEHFLAGRMKIIHDLYAPDIAMLPIGDHYTMSPREAAYACRFCRENFIAGVEVYGGLGSTEDGFSPYNTVHYVAPVVSWQVSDNGSLRFSPSFALTHEGSRVLLRFGYSYEVRGFGSKLAQLFGGRH